VGAVVGLHGGGLVPVRSSLARPVRRRQRLARPSSHHDADHRPPDAACVPGVASDRLCPRRSAPPHQRQLRVEGSKPDVLAQTKEGPRDPGPRSPRAATGRRPCGQ
jgi:hypothetical protein